MKDLFKPSKLKSKIESGSGDQHPVSSKNDVQQFLSKVAAMPKASGDARLIFSLE